jgi:RNA polymerase primary sigma factor
MTDTFGDFLNRIGKTPLLTAEEEILLSRQIQAWLALRDLPTPTREQQRVIKRGRRAYDRFFNANLRLAVYVAKQYASRASSMTLDDLVQEGCIGLSRGIEKFDSERGYKFSTYAYWWIRQSISRAIEMQDRMIRMPINSMQQITKVRRFMTQYQIKHGCMPTHKQCCEVSGMSLETYKNCLQVAGDCFSLDDVASTQLGRDTPLKELIADDRQLPMEYAEMSCAKSTLDKWQSTLSDTERDILAAHFGLQDRIPETLTEIGRRYEVSRELIRHKEQVAIRKMRYQAAIQ